MPIESASNITQLVVTNPDQGDGAGTADDHVRLIKTAVKGSFPGFTGSEGVSLSEAEINALPQDIADAIAAIANDLVPVGVINLWSGSTATIPTNWQLCDGTNGTPDLRSRFVVGAGSTYAVGATGGATSNSTSSAGAHDHGGSTAGHALTLNEMPAHNHGGGSSWSTTKDENSTVGPDYDPADNDATTTTVQTQGGGAAHSHGLSSDGAHTHTVNVLPPYYALAYIQKVA